MAYEDFGGESHLFKYRACTAIVVAGGRGSRLGGVDKPALEVAGTTMRARVVEALCGVIGEDARIVVVGEKGPDLDAYSSVTCVRETPPFSGPVAGLERGARELASAQESHGEVQYALVVGGDMPRLTPELLRALVAHADERHVWTVSDGTSQIHFLCAVWPLPLLREALFQVRCDDGSWSGVSMRRLYATMDGRLRSFVPANSIGMRGVQDVDTLEELASVREELGTRDSTKHREVSTEGASNDEGEH